MTLQQTYPTKHASRKLHHNHGIIEVSVGEKLQPRGKLLAQLEKGQSSPEEAIDQLPPHSVENDNAKVDICIATIKQAEEVARLASVRILEAITQAEENKRIEEAEILDAIARSEEARCIEIQKIREVLRVAEETEEARRLETTKILETIKQTEEARRAADAAIFEAAKLAKEIQHRADETMLEAIKLTEETQHINQSKEVEIISSAEERVESTTPQSSTEETPQAWERPTTEEISTTSSTEGTPQELTEHVSEEVVLAEDAPSVVYATVWGDNRNNVLTINALYHVTTAKPEQWDIPGISGGVLGTGYAVLRTIKGGLVSWGSNKFGQLGLLDYLDRDQPTTIDFFQNRRVSMVAGGESHVLLVTDDGQLYSWGNNGYGQLGNDIHGCTNTPQLISNEHKVIQVACGLYHSIALTETGEVYLWGLGGNGQLATATSKSNIPLKLNLEKKVCYVAAGEQNSFAVTEDGMLYGWGDNSYGQLSIPNSPMVVLSPTLINVPWDSKRTIKAIFASSHTMVLLDNGELYGTGHNRFGQVGIANSNGDNVNEFQLVLNSVLEIGVGVAHTVAVTAGGRLMVTGDNSKGQLAISPTVPVLKSTEFVVSDATGDHVIVGYDHNIAY